MLDYFGQGQLLIDDLHKTTFTFSLLEWSLSGVNVNKIFLQGCVQGFPASIPEISINSLLISMEINSIER